MEGGWFIYWFMYPKHAKSFRNCFAYVRRLHSCQFEQVFVLGYLGCFARENELSEFCISDVCHCLPIFWTHSSLFGFLSGNPFGMNGHLSTDFLLVLLHTNPKESGVPACQRLCPTPLNCWDVTRLDLLCGSRAQYQCTAQCLCA